MIDSIEQRTLPTEYTSPDWGAALRAFLAEKQRRSGSERTAAEYERILGHFFGRLEKAPDEITPDDVFTYTYGRGPTGQKPGSATIALRLAVISSLYRFLIRMGLVAANPADRVGRPRVESPPPRGLSPEEVRRLLAGVPDTVAGKRDRAIILICLLTGRRRAEVMSLRAGDLSRNGAVFYAYRGKGGKRGRRELPEPCFVAILDALRVAGRSLEDLAPEAPLFDVSPHGFYLNLRRYFRNAGLPGGGVHILRHTAAKLRRDAGESVEAVSRLLDHSNLAVTTTYLRRLEGDEDNGWRAVEALLNGIP